MNKSNRPLRKQHYSSLYLYSSICIEWGERFLTLIPEGCDTKGILVQPLEVKHLYCQALETVQKTYPCTAWTHQQKLKVVEFILFHPHWHKKTWQVPPSAWGRCFTPANLFIPMIISIRSWISSWTEEALQLVLIHTQYKGLLSPVHISRKLAKQLQNWAKIWGLKRTARWASPLFHPLLCKWLL